MDINLLRGLASLAVFLGFIGICIAVYSNKRKAFYQDAANIPFSEDSPNTDEDRP